MKMKLLNASLVGPVEESNPGKLFNKIVTDFRGWLLAGIGAFAAVQFILGCMDFMSKEPQKHSAGKDHMMNACLGLVGAFAASTIMSYLEKQTGTWTAFGDVYQQLLILSEATRSL